MPGRVAVTYFIEASRFTHRRVLAGYHNSTRPGGVKQETATRPGVVNARYSIERTPLRGDPDFPSISAGPADARRNLNVYGSRNNSAPEKSARALA
jgi:hypothetical protein